jgi:hypothetical protein
MTLYKTTHSSPYVLAGSALASSVISLVAALLVLLFAPAPVVTPHSSSLYEQSYKPSSSQPLFRLSPIPAGADWARS